MGDHIVFLKEGMYKQAREIGAFFQEVEGLQGIPGQKEWKKYILVRIPPDRYPGGYIEIEDIAFYIFIVSSPYVAKRFGEKYSGLKFRRRCEKCL